MLRNRQGGRFSGMAPAKETEMRVLQGGFLAVLLTFGFPALAPGATHEVQVGPGLSFNPKNLNIQVGDTVRWTNAGGFHNVVASGPGGFRCANGCDDTGGNGNPSAASWSFQRTFTQAGAIHYSCEVHSGSGMTGDITVAAGPAPCVPGATTLCLNDQRFKAELRWRIPDGTTGAGVAVPLDFAPDSGLFYFFQPSNIEMLVKVLDACAPPFERFWVFYAATTNVEFTLTVTDTQTGAVKTYTNPLNQSAAPVQDTNAFVCP
jgi:plastocyanin